MPPTASEVAGAVAAVRRRIAAAAERAGRILHLEKGSLVEQSEAQQGALT